MRNLIFFLTLTFLAFTGCKTPSYFSSANDLLRENCTVFMIDGTERKGELTIQLETGNGVKNKIHLTGPGNLNEEILIDSVKYFVFKNNSYYPKKIDLETYVIPNRDKLYLPDMGNVLFLKRLTKEGSKFNLYELYKSRNKSSDGTEQYDYFVSFPSDDRMTTWSIRSSKFFPRFEEKMSSLVIDCPSLSNKIIQKERGYFASQVSIDAKKYETVKRIVNEYNACQ